MGSRPERGAYGNARGKPDKQRRRRIVRENDPRYQEAMEEVRRNQEEIDRLAAADPTPHTPTLTRSKVSLVYERQMSMPETEPVKAVPKPPVIPQGRFAACHCGHSKEWHDGRVAPQCGFDGCDCPGYRPCTALDPLTRKTQIKRVDDLLERAKNSENKRTIALADKIETLLLDLEERVSLEEFERQQYEKTIAEREELQRIVAEAENAIREARAKLNKLGGTSKRTVQTKPAKSVVTRAGEYECPECGDKFPTPQGRGAHRAQKHGYRRER